MTKEKADLQTWQIFHVARRTLGPGAVANIFGRRNARSAYDWAADPAFTVQRVKRDPLQALHLMFSRLVDYGRQDVVKAAIDFLASALDDSTVCSIEELKPTLAEEILADFSAVAKLQDIIDEQASADSVREAAEEAIDEINRTVAKYIMERRHE